MNEVKVEEVIPTRMADMPLRGRLWVKWSYYAVILGLGVFATAGGVNAFFAVLFAAMFSFQYWTYAAWNGMIGAVRDKFNEKNPPDEDAEGEL